VNDDYYSLAAQVLPVLYLALVLEQRAIGRGGSNVYPVFGVLVKPTAPTRRGRYGIDVRHRSR
jgi:hypothetical protein